MRLHHYIQSSWLIVLLLHFVGAELGQESLAAEIVVNSTDDDGIDALPGNGVCETIPGNGICTLRAAVMEANGAPGPDTIRLQPGAVYVLTRPNPLTPDQDIVGAGGDLDLVNHDVTIVGNGATIDGNATERVFQVAGNISAVISSLTIRNGRDGNGGGVFSQGQLTLNNVTVTNNEATTAGGGIYVASGVLTMNNSIVSQNRMTSNDPRGGGIYVVTGTATIQDSFILKNTSVREGSAILNRGMLTVRRTLVSENMTTFGGGVMANGAEFGNLSPGTVVVEDSLITLNMGGGFYNVHPGNVTFRRSSILSNPNGPGLQNEAGVTAGTATLERTTISGHTTSGGSGISNRGMLFVRDNSVISDNVVTSGSGGSAIWNGGNAANAQILDSTIQNNRTTSGNFPDAAALLNLSGGRMTIVNSVIAENVGGNFGGGVHNRYDATEITITGSTIRQNRVLSQFGSGGGVFSAINCTITDTVFHGNSVPGQGSGGGLATSGNLTLRDSTLVGNQANKGAALFMSGGAGIMERCAFHGNTSGFQQSTLVIRGMMTNCTISGNLGAQGAGLLVNPGTSLTNVTVFGNNGWGLTTSSVAAAPITMQGSIVSGNLVQNCALFIPVTTLGGNIAADGTCGLSDPTDLPNTNPLLGPLAANGGLSLTHRLLLGSPAVDATAACPSHDQRNLMRPADGDNSGSAQCDIGAYEQQLTDCDDNGVFDLVDIDMGTWPDGNGNGVPDVCEVAGDVDGNGIVNLADHLHFRRCLDGPNSTPVAICALADADGDGDVDLDDFSANQIVHAVTP